jgi:hypothetical protein
MEATIEFIKKGIENLNGFGFPFLVFFIGVLEFSFGLYRGKWPKNERWVDIACFTLTKVSCAARICLLRFKVFASSTTGTKERI